MDLFLEDNMSEADRSSARGIGASATKDGEEADQLSHQYIVMTSWAGRTLSLDDGYTLARVCGRKSAVTNWLLH